MIMNEKAYNGGFIILLITILCLNSNTTFVCGFILSLSAARVRNAKNSGKLR